MFDGPGETGNTYCEGINGFGQIVGWYLDTDQGFVDDAESGDPGDPANFTLFDEPGSTYTDLWGINNNAELSGNYDGGGFVYHDGVFTNFTIGINGTWARGLNDNMQVVGQALGQPPSASGFVLTPSF